MRSGEIVQVGSGRDLYERPADSFVARFLGESNLIRGRVLAVSGGDATLAAGLDRRIVGKAGRGLAAGMPGSMLVRPEHVRHRPGGLKARVVEAIYLGELTALRLQLMKESNSVNVRRSRALEQAERLVGRLSATSLRSAGTTSSFRYYLMQQRHPEENVR